MEKIKKYKRTYFSAEVVQEVIKVFDQALLAVDQQCVPENDTLYVDLSEESWDHDNLNEFLADYRKADVAIFQRRGFVTVNDERALYTLNLKLFGREFGTEVRVSMPERPAIESIFGVFENYATTSMLPEPEEDKKVTAPPTIFIGHGRSSAWRDLKDHLAEQHGYSVQAYESGARAGHVIRDILQDMLSKSAFALLVLTGDDKVDDETYRARQNVVHETGLFQGRLGFSRAIVLLEEGVEEFSNMQGIERISFKKGNIKETYGTVLATLRREFVVET